MTWSINYLSSLPWLIKRGVWDCNDGWDWRMMASNTQIQRHFEEKMFLFYSYVSAKYLYFLIDFNSLVAVKRYKIGPDQVLKLFNEAK